MNSGISPAKKVQKKRATPRGEWPSSLLLAKSSGKTVLLDDDLCAGSFELFLGSLCGVLGNLLEDGLRSALDEILGFLQAEAGNDLTDDLDDLDLLVASRLEDDVELVLLFSSFCAGKPVRLQRRRRREQQR